MRLTVLAVGPLGIGLPLDASKEGWRIDEMINVTSLFVGVIFAIMIVCPDLEKEIENHQTPPRKSTWPVMKSLSGRMKKSITLLTSRSSPGRFIAWRFKSSISLSSGTDLMRSVWIGVGATTFAVIPNSANSRAMI